MSAIDDIAGKLGVVSYRPSYHGEKGDANTVLLYTASPGQADRQNRDAKRLRELEAENRALRKKLEEKDGVIDVLKKSVGILSKP